MSNALSKKLHGLRAILKFDNWIQLILNRTIFRHTSLNVYRLGKLEIVIDHTSGDENGARLLLTTPLYSDLLEKMKFPHRLSVLDLGANIGGFPLMLQNLGAALEKVVCVEFNPNTFSRMRFNLERNLLCKEFMPLNIAVTGDYRSVVLPLSGGGTGESIYGMNTNQLDLVHQIEGIPFDAIYERSFGENTVDICKIDIEGAEYEVFALPHHETLRLCRWLLIEIHTRPGKISADVLNELKRLKFVLVGTSPLESCVHLFENSNPPTQG